jgi:hypothetical protein
LGIADVDVVNGLITFRTSHLGDYVIFYLNKDLRNGDAVRQSAYSGCNFQPDYDGFFIPNFSTEHALMTGGNCMGMAVFANWYYVMRKIGYLYDIPLYYKWREGVFDDCVDDIIAHEVAHRAWCETNQMWIFLDVCMQDLFGIFDDATTGWFLWAALELLEQPVCLQLSDYDHLRFHVITVYGYSYSTEKFYCYDNNYPGEIVEIGYSPWTGFVHYTPKGQTTVYSDFAFDTAETMLQHFVMNDIYKRAESYGSQLFPTINITSHNDNDAVYTSKVLLQGELTGGEHPEYPMKMEVFVNGQKYTTPFYDGFKFRVEVPLDSGENSILFYASKPYNSEPKGVYYAAVKQMNLMYASGPQPDILVILTWDKYNTDVDLYVQEATGEVCYHANKLTVTGGELDMDSQFGFGPERYMVITDEGDILVPNGTYNVRIHYFNDHFASQQPITYRVSVLVQGKYEVFTGSISTYNPLNGGFSSTGPDWRDITSFEVIE